MKNTDTTQAKADELVERELNDVSFHCYMEPRDAAKELIELRAQLAAAEAREPIESECCREDTRSMEPCGPFIDLQRENEELETKLASARKAVEEIARLECGPLHPAVSYAREALRSLSDTTGEKQ